MDRPIHNDDLSFLAHRFQSTRIRLNLRVPEVLDEADYRMGCDHVRDIERGKPVPDAVYERIAQVLEIDFEKLTDELRNRCEERLRVPPQDLPPRVLGKLLASARNNAGLTVEETISRTGLSPSQTYERRLRRLEAGRDRLPAPHVLEALADALGISPYRLFDAYMKECEYYDEMGGQPNLIIRAMAAVYLPQPLPQGLDTAVYLDQAAAFSVEVNRRVALVFPDKRSVYIRPDGLRAESFRPPTMRFR